MGSQARFHGDGDPLWREARASGLRPERPLSLGAVERRRTELLITGLIVLAVAGFGGALAVWAGGRNITPIPTPLATAGLVLLVLGFTAYLVEKEVHLRRLGRLLQAQQMVNLALQNRVRELSSMVAMAKAVDAAETLTELLDAVLSGALRLVDGAGAAMALPDTRGVLRVAATVGDAGVEVGQELPDGEAADALAAEMWARNRRVGVLRLTAGPGGRSAYDERVLETFSEQAGIWVANHLARAGVPG